MPEPQPPPATPGAPPPPAAAPAQAPGILPAFRAVLTRPAEFYASVRDVGGFGAPLVFALVMGLASGVLTAIVGLLGLGAAGGAGGAGYGMMVGFGAIVGTPIFAVIGCFIGGAIVLVISMIAGGKGTYEQSVRIAAYAAAVMPFHALLGVIPLLGTLSTLYGLYLVTQGVVAIHGADRQRVRLVATVLAVLVILMSIAGWVNGRAAQRMGADADARFGPSSEFEREMRKAQDELQRANDELQRKQQQR